MARITSTQKLPRPLPCCPSLLRHSPRARASATPNPAAAEVKLCQAKAAICAK